MAARAFSPSRMRNAPSEQSLANVSASAATSPLGTRIPLVSCSLISAGPHSQSKEITGKPAAIASPRTRDRKDGESVKRASLSCSLGGPSLPQKQIHKKHITD